MNGMPPKGSVSPSYSAEEVVDALEQARGKPSGSRNLPTAEQAAVIAAGPGATLVVAGAGSGKTTTVSQRVAWLVANGFLNPEELLGITFTVKATGELRNAITENLYLLSRSGLIDNPDQIRRSMGPTISTYHSFAGSLVKEFGLRVGIEPDVTVISQAQSWQFARQAVENYTGDMSHVAALADTLTKHVLTLSGQCAEHGRNPLDIREYCQEYAASFRQLPYRDGKPKILPSKASLDYLDKVLTKITVAEMVADYQQVKREAEVIDFGDQLMLARRLVANFPEVAEMIGSRFSTVLLDEFQDTSHVQLELFHDLFSEEHTVTAVGDPTQSIYSWRGASAGGLARFAEVFGKPAAPTKTLALSTSWRNDTEILGVANKVAYRETASEMTAGVPVLKARPGANAGRVEFGRCNTVFSEASAVAGRIKYYWDQGRESGENFTMAVLCRRKALMPQIARELAAYGVPTQIVGVSGLLSQPEVVDIVSYLRVVVDPARSDALFRVLTGARWRIGLSDMAALAEWSSRVARRRMFRGRATAAEEENVVGEEFVDEVDTVDYSSLVEGIDELPSAPDFAGRRSFTPEGFARLQKLAQELRYIRTASPTGLLSLIETVIDVTGVDVEVSANPLHEQTYFGGHLGQFMQYARQFSSHNPGAGVAAFLRWLEIADNEEDGLSLAKTEPSAEAVQLLTIHAAKGLEWDIVAVPGMSEGSFPTTPRESLTWDTNPGLLPFSLRGDYAELPHWGGDVLQHSFCPDQRTWLQEHEIYRDLLREHSLQEERRLAYVAFTRARHVLMLSSFTWSAAQKPAESSVFLQELLADIPEENVSWFSREEITEDNPLVDQFESQMWPYDPLQERREAVAALAKKIQDIPSETLERIPDFPPDSGVDLGRTISFLLAQQSQEQQQIEVEFPQHISASSMITLREDPGRVAMELRRPMPRKPRENAHRGTRFHAWVEQYFGAASLLDVEDLTGAADEDAGVADLSAVQEVFENSVWGNTTPYAIEVPFEMPLAGIVVRGRIDAVYRWENSWEMVDWKTGRVPVGEELQRKAIQLAIYRLAWSKLHDVPLNDIGAAFYYVDHDETVRVDRLAGEEELTDIVISALRHGR